MKFPEETWNVELEWISILLPAVSVVTPTCFVFALSRPRRRSPRIASAVAASSRRLQACSHRPSPRRVRQRPSIPPPRRRPLPLRQPPPRRPRAPRPASSTATAPPAASPAAPKPSATSSLCSNRWRPNETKTNRPRLVAFAATLFRYQLHLNLTCTIHLSIEVSHLHYWSVLHSSMLERVVFLGILSLSVKTMFYEWNRHWPFNISSN